MLAEVRSLVAPQDLEIFDRLVLHREREAHQSWHGGLGVLHPHGLHSPGVSGSQGGGAASPAVVGGLIRLSTFIPGRSKVVVVPVQGGRRQWCWVLHLAANLI